MGPLLLASLCEVRSTGPVAQLVERGAYTLVYT